MKFQKAKRESNRDLFFSLLSLGLVIFWVIDFFRSDYLSKDYLNYLLIVLCLVSIPFGIYRSIKLAKVKYGDQPILELTKAELKYELFKKAIPKESITRFQYTIGHLNSYAGVVLSKNKRLKWYQISKKRNQRKYGSHYVINLDLIQGEDPKEHLKTMMTWLKYGLDERSSENG